MKTPYNIRKYEYQYQYHSNQSPPVFLWGIRIIMNQVSAKTVVFELNSSDMTDDVYNSLDVYAKKHSIDNYCVFEDGKVMLHRPTKKIHLMNGGLTLQTALGCEHMPSRVTKYSPLPFALWFDMFPSGYDTEKFVRCTGERFQRKCVAKLLDQEANKAVARKNYAHTMSSTVTELLEDGSVTIENAQKIAATKKFATQQRAVDSSNPDLTGACIEITFAHYKYQQPTKKYLETKVQLIGYPNNTLQKKKHYYIYTYKSGFGKTFHMQKFTREYNAHFIGDLGNWLSVPEHTQFLIIDEISVGRGCRGLRSTTHTFQVWSFPGLGSTTQAFAVLGCPGIRSTFWCGVVQGSDPRPKPFWFWAVQGWDHSATQACVVWGYPGLRSTTQVFALLCCRGLGSMTQAFAVWGYQGLGTVTQEFVV